MPPREESSTTRASSPPSSQHQDHSSFWGCLTSLPLVKSSADIYQKSKHKNGLFELGLGAVELGFKLASKPLELAANTLKDYCPDKVAAVESRAVECLHSLEITCPAMTQPADEVAEDLKVRSDKAFKRGVRAVLRSFPGQCFIKSINMAIECADDAIDILLPEEKTVHTRAVTRKQMAAQSTGMLSKMKVRKIVTAPLWVPLKIGVVALRRVKWILASLAGVRRKSHLSPSKKAEIHERRKVSPRKRLHQTRIQQFVNTLLRPLGISYGIKSNDIRLYCVPQTKDDSPTNKAGQHEKRKYSDMSGASDDEDEDSDLDVFNLEEYDSGDDPDYKPDKNESVDSLEFQEGDTESDIEAQLKEDETTTPKISDKVEKSQDSKGEVKKGNGKSSPKMKVTVSNVKGDSKVAGHEAKKGDGKPSPKGKGTISEAKADSKMAGGDAKVDSKMAGGDAKLT